MSLNTLDPAHIKADRPILSRWVVTDLSSKGVSMAIMPNRHNAALWLLNRRFARTLVREGWLLGVIDILEPKPATATVHVMQACAHDTLGSLAERFLAQEEAAGTISLVTESEWRAANIPLATFNAA